MSTLRNARAFQLTATLGSFPSLKEIIPLEGVLFDARFRRDPETYGTPLDCLAQDEGVYRASGSILVADGISGVTYDATPVVKRIDSRGAGLNRMDFSGKERVAISQMSPLRPSLEREPLLTGVSKVVWTGYGDMDEVYRLIRHVPGVGKLRSRGYGMVTDWDISEIMPSEESDIGWFAKGMLLRRLPYDVVMRRLGAIPKGATVRNDRVEPPFWEGKEGPKVVIPTLRSMTVTSAGMRELLAG